MVIKSIGHRGIYCVLGVAMLSDFLTFRLPDFYDICAMERMERVKEMLLASPNDNFLRHALALEYIKEGNDTEARILFEAILTDSPDYTGSYYHLGKLLERAGETPLAIAWYQKGMQYAKQAGSRHAYNELQTAYEDLVY